jgi:hypothetical protein
MAVMMAVPAAPMNVGRFSTAQSRDAVSVEVEPWKWGAT